MYLKKNYIRFNERCTIIVVKKAGKLMVAEVRPLSLRSSDKTKMLGLENFI